QRKRSRAMVTGSVVMNQGFRPPRRAGQSLRSAVARRGVLFAQRVRPEGVISGGAAPEANFDQAPDAQRDAAEQAELEQQDRPGRRVADRTGERPEDEAAEQ